jgi:hypothetical protein
MGRTMGLEPTASGTTTRRSNQLSYVRRKTEVIIAKISSLYNSFKGVYQAVLAFIIGFLHNIQTMSAETNRQYLAEPTNVAYTNNAGATCPGGQLLTDCETVTEALQGLADLVKPPKPGTTGATETFPNIPGKTWRIPKWLSADCGVCGQRCEPALQTEGSESTGLTKVSFYEIAKD